jgi:hypothetical protein
MKRCGDLPFSMFIVSVLPGKVVQTSRDLRRYKGFPLDWAFISYWVLPAYNLIYCYSYCCTHYREKSFLQVVSQLPSCRSVCLQAYFPRLLRLGYLLLSVGLSCIVAAPFLHTARCFCPGVPPMIVRVPPRLSLSPARVFTWQDGLGCLGTRFVFAWPCACGPFSSTYTNGGK